jgi:ribosomal protein S18 acetylase RimI-like enzyme
VTAVRFCPIDFERHAALCIEFRRDAFVCSFGSAGGADEVEHSGGTDGYLAWLRARQAEFPQGVVHAFAGSEVVGQLELARRGREARVHLFYAVPHLRGTGIGDALHDHAITTLTAAGAHDASLLVSPTNGRALRYYEKHGWVDGGPVPGRDDLRELWLRLR